MFNFFCLFSLAVNRQFQKYSKASTRSRSPTLSFLISTFPSNPITFPPPIPQGRHPEARPKHPEPFNSWLGQGRRRERERGRESSNPDNKSTLTVHRVFVPHKRDVEDSMRCVRATIHPFHLPYPPRCLSFSRDHPSKAIHHLLLGPRTRPGVADRPGAASARASFAIVGPRVPKTGRCSRVSSTLEERGCTEVRATWFE